MSPDPDRGLIEELRLELESGDELMVAAAGGVDGARVYLTAVDVDQAATVVVELTGEEAIDVADRLVHGALIVRKGRPDPGS